MTLKLKTNRNNIVVCWLPLLSIGLCLFIVMLIEVYCTDKIDVASKEQLIVHGVFWGGYLLGILLYKFLGRKRYLFTTETIKVFSLNKQVNQFTVKDIEYIKYVRLDIYYVWHQIRGAVEKMQGDACDMYLCMNNGNQITLGTFSTRDAKKLQKLYGDLVRIV